MSEASIVIMVSNILVLKFIESSNPINPISGRIVAEVNLDFNKKEVLGRYSLNTDLLDFLLNRRPDLGFFP